MTQVFTHKKIRDGVNLFICPTKKFKTILVQVFFHQQLDREKATQTALFPMLMMRGSQNYPTNLKITQELEGLYGAELGSDILKKGERQILTFALELVNEQYTPGNERVFESALKVFRDIVFNPFQEDGAFKESYLRQEKEQLKKQIQGLINDKMSLALERCVQEMCREERYGTFKYGYLDKVDEIKGDALFSYYLNFMETAPVDIFVVGDIDLQETAAMIEKSFLFDGPAKKVIPATVVHKNVQEVKVVEEKMNVKQGKLTLGYRTNTPYGEDTFPLVFYSGILGGFSHSKLFQNVREKASLAYYAMARLEKTKGLMLVTSGIEFENYEKALDIIKEQVESMKQGSISDYEFDNTRKALLSQAKLVEDNPYQWIGSTLEGTINNLLLDQGEIVAKLEKVTREDVIRIAQKIELDTIYFLRN